MKGNFRPIAAIALTLINIALCACAGGGRTDTASLPPAPPTQAEIAPTSPPALPSASPDTSSEASQLPAQQQEEEEDAVPFTPGDPSGEVVVSFEYTRQSGSASNQYAVWVEDMEGNYINTLYATQWTAKGGYDSRPDSIALWVAKSGISSMPDYYVDAISGATPKASGSQSYTWNLKDINGDTVLYGEYKVFVEGTLRWKNYVLFSGTIMISDTPVTIQADAEYIYEASDRQAALTWESPENGMISAVNVRRDL